MGFLLHVYDLKANETLSITCRRISAQFQPLCLAGVVMDQGRPGFCPSEAGSWVACSSAPDCPLLEDLSQAHMNSFADILQTVSGTSGQKRPRAKHRYFPLLPAKASSPLKLPAILVLQIKLRFSSFPKIQLNEPIETTKSVVVRGCGEEGMNRWST